MVDSKCFMNEFQLLQRVHDINPYDFTNLYTVRVILML